MKALARLIGWLIVIGGALGITYVIWGVATQHIRGNFLSALLICAPIVLVMVIGGWLTRVGRRKEWVESDVPVWTRRGPV